MLVTGVLATSILLQYVAAGLALRLIRVTGWWTAWSVVASAILLMAVRRTITMVQLLGGSVELPTSLAAEIVALLISTLMVVGMYWLGPLLQSAQDLTQALRESEQKYRTLVERSLQGIIIYQQDRIRFANAAAAEIVGFSVSELMAMSPDGVRSMLHPNDREIVLDRAARRLAGENLPARHEIRVMRRDGGVRWLEEYASLVEYGGEPALQCAYIDITARREAQIAHRRSERRLSMALSTGGLAWWEWDIRTGAVVASEQKAGMLGYAPGEETPDLQWWIAQIHPDDYERAMQAMRDHLEGRTSRYEIEYRLKTRDGQWRWFSDRGGIVERDAQGKPLRLTGVAQDISNRKQSEEALQKAHDELELRVQARTAELAAANEGLRREIAERHRAEANVRRREAQLARVSRRNTLGEMSAGLAHQLNQPLCAIVSSAQLAQQMLDNGDSPPTALRNVLANLVEDSQYASGVIRHLREFLTSGQLSLTRRCVNTTIRAVGDLLFADANHQSATVWLDLADDLPLVKADEVQLQQVVLNVAHNGLEALTQDPDDPREVTISTRATADGGVEIEISDTGYGISDEAALRGTEPFFTSKNDGVGMGLSISQSIIEAHGGKLRICRRQPRGTTVTCVLPPLDE